MKLFALLLFILTVPASAAVSLKKMCATDFSSPGGPLRPSIVKCGTYFRATYAATDTPAYILDEKGTVMATCGGLPLPAVGPDGGHAPVLCETACEPKNLCAR